jgi:hypothetical protein
MTYMPTSDASDFFALLSSHTSGGQSLFSRAEKPASLRNHGHDIPTDSDVFRSAHNGACRGIVPGLFDRIAIDDGSPALNCFGWWDKTFRLKSAAVPT